MSLLCPVTLVRLLIRPSDSLQCSGFLQIQITSSANRSFHLFLSDLDDFSFFFLAWLFCLELPLPVE